MKLDLSQDNFQNELVKGTFWDKFANSLAKNASEVMVIGLEPLI